MRKLTLILMAALIVAAAVSCTVKERGGKSAATVNGAAIPEGVIKWMMKERMAEHRGANVAEATMRNAVLDAAIADKLLAGGAKEKGLSVTDTDLRVHMDAAKNSVGDDKFAQALKDAGLTEQDYAAMTRDRILSSMFVKSLFSESSLTDDVLKDAYNKLQTPIMMPDTVTIRFMQMPDEKSALKVAAEIKAAGGNFDKVADRYQRDKRAVVSGYGEVAPSFLGDAISSAVNTMSLGAWTGPVKSKAGYYLLRLKQRNPSRPKTFDEAKEDLRRALTVELRNQAVSKWLAERKGSAKIVIGN